MILFGGRTREATSGPYTLFDDVWALDLQSLAWQRLEPAGTPPRARSSVAGVLNPDTRELLLFGGNASTSGASFEPLDDVWALDLVELAWREIAAAGVKPEARLFHATTIDPASGRLFVYGGGGAGAFLGPFMGDLWSFDPKSGAWSEESPGGVGAPLGRINASLTFDSDRGRLVLFAGHDDGEVGNNNDTWAFDPKRKQWTAIVPPEVVQTPAPQFCLFPPDFTRPNLAAPDRRSAALAVLDAAAGRWLVYGGKTDCGNIDDVWSFDLEADAWQRELEARLGEACVRGDRPEQCATLCI
jgi:hypothetical protein